MKPVCVPSQKKEGAGALEREREAREQAMRKSVDSYVTVFTEAYNRAAQEGRSGTSLGDSMRQAALIEGISTGFCMAVAIYIFAK